MKKLITLLFIIIGLTSFAQTTINPDTICANATGEVHFVTNTPGSTYQWIISGNGTLATGQGTNSITTDWGNAPGLYINAVSVTETNSNGCLGNPINLDVYILNLGISPLFPFCIGDPPQVLVANHPGGQYLGTGVVGNTFDPFVAGIGTHIVSYSFGGCSTSINVIVNTGPITGPIQHY